MPSHQSPSSPRSASSWYPAYTGPAGSPLWLDEPLLCGEQDRPPESCEIAIIGSGLSGVSAAYWLRQRGFTNITLLDWRPEDAASNRNCGHILYGTVESAQALKAIKGEKIASDLLSLSVELCHDVRTTIAELQLDCDYQQDGYLVMALDSTEMAEIEASAALLNQLGIENRLLAASDLARMGYLGVVGARFEPGGARAHPVKFRNGLLRHTTADGTVRHLSGIRVDAVADCQGQAEVWWQRPESSAHGCLRADAVVIAGNAYSPLFSDYFASRRLVEPFRGQIIASEPLSRQLPFTGAQSFDHGYIYAVMTTDRRLVIGGWRNHTPGGEVGTYDLTTNPEVAEGLRAFAAEHYAWQGEAPRWTRGWSGIMAASRTGLPFIGPTSSPSLFALAGYTGHGFSWAHGSARILADIMAGTGTWRPELLSLFNPAP